MGRLICGIVGNHGFRYGDFRLEKARMLKQARDWPVAEGFVLHTGQSDADGIRKVSLSYLYKVHDEEFYASESFTFTIYE